jgi:transposase
VGSPSTATTRGWYQFCAPHLYATVDADAHPDLLAALHGRWRVATRLVMILLSARGFHAAQVAGLLGYDPRTVRRWIHRYQTHGIGGLADRPRPGRPRLGGPKLAQRIATLLATPRAWTIPRLWQRLGRPGMSLRTLHRRTGAVASWRRPRLVAKADPTATSSWPSCTKPSPNCPRVRWCWPRTRPTCTCCPGCGRPGSPEGSGSR